MGQTIIEGAPANAKQPMNPEASGDPRARLYDMTTSNNKAKQREQWRRVDRIQLSIAITTAIYCTLTLGLFLQQWCHFAQSQEFMLTTSHDAQRAYVVPQKTQVVIAEMVTIDEKR